MNGTKRLFTTILLLLAVAIHAHVGSAASGTGSSIGSDTHSGTNSGTNSETGGSSLKLSSMQVVITANGQTATFRLYETQAAREFYDQLPLSLPLSNFRDAQWMFYPPEKLNVTPEEAYHDGKKGELSYYAPWGDVFMLYKDFHAGDAMHRLGIPVSGSDSIARMSGTAIVRQAPPESGDTTMHLTIEANGKRVVFALNNSQASRELGAQTPLTVAVEDYGGKEKIFYPPEKLSTTNTPPAKNIKAGTLAYYAPWGDVVLFYDTFHPASGLYALGHAIEGTEHIQSLEGEITITSE